MIFRTALMALLLQVVDQADPVYFLPCVLHYHLYSISSIPIFCGIKPRAS